MDRSTEQIALTDRHHRSTCRCEFIITTTLQQRARHHPHCCSPIVVIAAEAAHTSVTG